jgi:hypothetical protein
MKTYISLTSKQDIDGQIKFGKAFKEASGMERIDLLKDWIGQLESLYLEQHALVFKQDETPILIAKKVDGRAKIFCPHCLESHTHGWWTGHRVPHCSGRTGRPQYFIQCIGNQS